MTCYIGNFITHSCQYLDKRLQNRNFVRNQMGKMYRFRLFRITGQFSSNRENIHKKPVNWLVIRGFTGSSKYIIHRKTLDDDSDPNPSRVTLAYKNSPSEYNN